MLELRNRSALAVNCCVIIHCLEVSCKEDQITSAQTESSTKEIDIFEGMKVSHVALESKTDSN